MKSSEIVLMAGLGTLLLLGIGSGAYLLTHRHHATATPAPATSSASPTTGTTIAPTVDATVTTPFTAAGAAGTKSPAPADIEAALLEASRSWAGKFNGPITTMPIFYPV